MCYLSNDNLLLNFKYEKKNKIINKNNNNIFSKKKFIITSKNLQFKTKLRSIYIYQF